MLQRDGPYPGDPGAKPLSSGQHLGWQEGVKPFSLWSTCQLLWATCQALSYLCPPHLFLQCPRGPPSQAWWGEEFRPWQGRLALQCFPLTSQRERPR